MISIIVPVFESEKTIKRCLESILNQSYQDFEIVVVYKEGNDKTLDVINSLHDSRIRVVYKLQKSGPGGARNIGIDSSTGEYLGFVESDDFIEKDFYRKLYQRIENDKSDIAWGEICKQDKNTMWTLHDRNSVETVFFEKYSKVSNGASFDKLFKASLIKNHSIRFTEKLRYEDNPFLLKAFYYSDKISLVKNAIYFYGPTPHSSEYREKLKRCVIPIAAEMTEFAKACHFSQWEMKLLQKKIIKSFASSFIFEPDVYIPLKEISGIPFRFKIRYLKRKLKSIFKRKNN